MTTTNKNHLQLINDDQMESPPAGSCTLGYLRGELTQKNSYGDESKILTDSGLGGRVLGTELDGLSTADSSPVTEENSVLEGIGKLQAQANNKLDALKNYSGGKKSEFFHESDGGGYQFSDNNEGTVSFLGCNDDPSSPIEIEIYSKKSTSGEGSRIIQTLNKTYYTSGKTDSSFSDNDEIATQGNLPTAGHVIVNAEGDQMAQRGKLRFQGDGVESVADDETNNETIVTLVGGSGGGGMTNPMDSLGDLIVGVDATGSPGKLSAGSTGQNLATTALGTLGWALPNSLYDYYVPTALDGSGYYVFNGGSGGLKFALQTGCFTGSGQYTPAEITFPIPFISANIGFAACWMQTVTPSYNYYFRYELYSDGTGGAFWGPETALCRWFAIGLTNYSKENS
jgi:hypothetical protein